jgi:flagellum-specific peptidoglycan hydrolase FlgJ
MPPKKAAATFKDGKYPTSNNFSSGFALGMTGKSWNIRKLHRIQLHCAVFGRCLLVPSTHNTTQNTQHRTHNTQHRTHNTEHTTQNTQHRTHNTEHTTQNTQHRTHNTEHHIIHSLTHPVSRLSRESCHHLVTGIFNIQYPYFRNDHNHFDS